MFPVVSSEGRFRGYGVHCLDSHCLEVYSLYIPVTLWNHIRNSFSIYTGLPRICFALNLSDMWLLMAIRASDKSLLWTAALSAVPELCSVSVFTGVTLWPFSMQGDSVESPKNSELWIPDHSWRFTVDQDPVSSKQGASAGQEQLRGSHAASLQGQDTRDPLCLWELRTLCHWTQKLHFVNWSFEPRDFPENAPSSWDWNCLCVRRMLHRTLHFSLQYYAHRGTFVYYCYLW